MFAELEDKSTNFYNPGSTIELLMNIKITKALEAEKPRIKIVLPTSWKFEASSFEATILAHKRYNELNSSS